VAGDRKPGSYPQKVPLEKKNIRGPKPLKKDLSMISKSSRGRKMSGGPAKPKAHEKNDKTRTGG